MIKCSFITYVGLTAWKVSKYGVIPGSYFPVFCSNTGKYRPEIIPFLDTFHAVSAFKSCSSHLHFRYSLFYEQGVDWTPGDFLNEVSLNSGMWHDNKTHYQGLHFGRISFRSGSKLLRNSYHSAGELLSWKFLFQRNLFTLQIKTFVNSNIQFSLLKFMNLTNSYK